MRSSDNTSKKARILAAIIGIVMLAAVAIAGTWSLSSDDIDEAKASDYVYGNCVVLQGSEESGYKVTFFADRYSYGTSIEWWYADGTGLTHQCPSVPGGIAYCNFEYVLDWDAVWQELSDSTGLDVKSKVDEVRFIHHSGEGWRFGQLSGMFKGFTALESVSMPSLDVNWLSQISGMASMFEGCSSLTSVSLPSQFWSGGDITSEYAMKVSSTESMFKDCSSLRSIDLGFLRTAHADFPIDCSSMFEGCSSLSSLNFARTDDSAIILSNASSMFKGCSSLKAIDITRVKTGSVSTDSSEGAFEGADSLEWINFCEWGTTSPLPAGTWYPLGTAVFNPGVEPVCGAISTSEARTIKAAGYGDGSNQQPIGILLYHSEEDLPDVWGTSKGDLSFQSVICEDCTSGTGINGARWEDVFSSYAQSIQVFGFVDDGSKYLFTNNGDRRGAERLFYSWVALEEIQNLGSLFLYGSELSQMFYNCSSLASVSLRGLDTCMVTDASEMFYGCSLIPEIDLSVCDLNQVTNIDFMFYNCENLQTIYVSQSSWKECYRPKSDRAFYNCRKLVGGNGTSYCENEYHDIFETWSGGAAARIDRNGYMGMFTERAYRYATLSDGVLSIVKSDDPLDQEDPRYDFVYPEIGLDWGIDEVAWRDQAGIVSEVVISSVTELESARGWFKDMVNLTKVSGLGKLRAWDMTSLFEGCTSLTSVSFEGASTSFARMARAFKGCEQLEVVDLARKMFCPMNNDDGTGLDVDGNLEEMFAGCSSLTAIHGRVDIPTSLPSPNGDGQEVPIDVSDLGSQVFAGCTALRGGGWNRVA